MVRKNTFTALLIALMLLLTGSVAEAQQVIRVLAIGNSFSEDAVEQNLYELAHEAGYELIIGNAYRGGQGLSSHWNVVSKHEADFEYRKVVNGKRTNKTKVLLDDIVKDEPWDIITFQQVSQDAGRYDTYKPYLQNLIDYVKGIATGKNVRYGFHQTWAYAQNSTHSGFIKYARNQKRMYNAICDATQKALADHLSLTFVVPSGTAIQNARTSGLDDNLNRDGYHLDYGVGRYTAACTWLEMLTGVSPTTITWRPDNVTAGQAYLARLSAHDAVQQPYTITDEPSGIDTLCISMFGSSVAYGTGAHDNHGYAWRFNNLLTDRFNSHESPHAFHISNISIGGNTTKNLLDRFKDVMLDLGKYVIFGMSLGNEGIHGAADQEKIFKQWRDNMLTLIRKVRQNGKVPLVMNNYGRGDFNSDDYHYVKEINMLIHEWDVPSFSSLGAIDDGEGHWATGYQNDTYHPTSDGHQEICDAIVPSVFDALASGKKLVMERDSTHSLTLGNGDLIKFTCEDTVHPFTISVRVKSHAPGTLFSFANGTRSATVSVDAAGKVVYKSTTNRMLTSNVALDDDKWHTVSLVHYYAQSRVLLYVDSVLAGEMRERIKIGDVQVGSDDKNVFRDFSELFFWRAGMCPEEIQGIVDGKLLKSSLELYVPMTSPTSLFNLAMSLNEVKYVDNSATAISTPVVNTPKASHYYTLHGVRVPAPSAKGIYIHNGVKMVVK